MKNHFWITKYKKNVNVFIFITQIFASKNE